MSSIKARKGNPFEKDVAYSLIQGRYKVIRPDDNTKGVDLVASLGPTKHYIECKNRKKLTWNELRKIYEKTVKSLEEKDILFPIVRVVFHTNQQPVLVFWKPAGADYVITTFDDAFLCPFQKRPKGYKIWLKENKDV